MGVSVEDQDDFNLDLSLEDLEFLEVDIDKLGEGDALPPDEGAEPVIEGEEQSDDVTGDEEEEEDELGSEADAEEQERVGGESTEPKEGTDASSPKLYSTLAEVLKEQGVFDSVDESSIKDVKDVDSLVGAIKKQIESQEFKDLTEQQRVVLQDMRQGVSTDTASKFKTAMDKLDTIDEEVINNNKQARFDLIYQDFISKGFNDEKAKKYANRSFEMGDDISDAIEAKDNLKNTVKAQYDAVKQKEIDEAKAEQDKVAKTRENLEKTILESEKVFEDMPVDERMRKEILAEVTKMVAVNPKTGVPENALMKMQREDPVGFSHKLYYLFKVTNGFKDTSFFGRKKVSNSVSKLESALRQSSHVNGGGKVDFSDDPNSSILDIGEIISPYQ